MPTVHIESKRDEIANIVLMPGDPNRSEYIAKKYLKDYKLVNSVRGMKAYTGYYKDKLITVFPSGMGNPSMGIYSYELYKDYGVDCIVRIGSCGGYSERLKLKDVILVSGSYSESNYAYQMNGYKDKLIESDNTVNNIIESTAKTLDKRMVKGNIYCCDAFYEMEYDYKDRVKKLDVLGIEMESFALFSNAKKFNKKAACLLTVSDLFFSDEKLSSLEREKELNDMIVLALESCLKL
ncbi:MAG: purine-nucleoside phosphorylase [Bacilli bacterium]